MAQSPFDLMTQFGTSIEDTKKLIAGLKPYKEQAVADFEAQKQIQAKIAEIRTKPVTVMPAFQAKALGFNIPDLGPDSDQWQIKFLADTKDPQGFKVSFISPTGWEQTQDGLFISPATEGSKTYTREQLNQLIQENKDQQAQFEKTRSIFGKVFPGGDMAAIKAFADTDDKGFQQWIFQAGDSEDARFIMKKVYQITDEQLDAFFHPTQVLPPESVVSPSDEGAVLTPAPSVPVIIPAEGFTMQAQNQQGQVVDLWINQDYQVWVGNENNPTYWYNHETGEFEALTGATEGLTPEQRVQKFDVSRGREALQTPVAPAKAQKPMQLAIQNNQIGTIDPGTGAFTPIDASKLQGGPVTPQPQVTAPQGPGLTMDFQGLPEEPRVQGAAFTQATGQQFIKELGPDILRAIVEDTGATMNTAIEGLASILWAGQQITGRFAAIPLIPKPTADWLAGKGLLTKRPEVTVDKPLFQEGVPLVDQYRQAKEAGEIDPALVWLYENIPLFAADPDGFRVAIKPLIPAVKSAIKTGGKAIGQAGREIASGIPSALEQTGKVGLKPITFQASEGAGAIGKGPLKTQVTPIEGKVKPPEAVSPRQELVTKASDAELKQQLSLDKQQIKTTTNASLKEYHQRNIDLVETELKRRQHPAAVPAKVTVPEVAQPPVKAAGQGAVPPVEPPKPVTTSSDEVKRFSKWLQDPKTEEAQGIWENFKTKVRSKRIEAYTAREDEIFKQTGDKLQAHKQALEELKGEIPRTTTQEFVTEFTSELFKTIDDKIPETMSYERVATKQALLDAIQKGRSIPRIKGAGTELFPQGGSAYDRLMYVFGDNPELLKQLESGKPLKDVIDSKLLVAAKEFEPLKQIDWAPTQPIGQGQFGGGIFEEPAKRIPTLWDNAGNPTRSMREVFDEMKREGIVLKKEQQDRMMQALDEAYQKYRTTEPLTPTTPTGELFGFGTLWQDMGPERTMSEIWKAAKKANIDIKTDQVNKMMKWLDDTFRNFTKDVEFQPAPIKKQMLQPSLFPVKEQLDIVKLLKEIGLTVLDIGNGLRAVKASFDNSFMRQLAKIIPSHPVKSAKGIVTSWKAVFSQKAADEAWQTLIKKPAYQLYDNLVGKYESGDFIRPLYTKEGTPAWKMTEEFGYLNQERAIPGFLSKVPGIKHSNRGFITGSNEILFPIFEDYIKILEQKALKVASGEIKLPAGQAFDMEKELHEMMVLLSDMSARASLGKAKGAAKFMGSAFFAPRKMVADIIYPRHLISTNPMVRKEAWKTLSIFAGTTVGIEQAGEQLGIWEVGKDMNSPNFMRIRMGNTWLDPWGGALDTVKLANKLVTGQGTSATTGIQYDSTDVNSIVHYLKGRLHPATTSVIEAKTGKTYLGEEVNYKNVRQWLDRVGPMVFSDIVDAVKESGGYVAAATLFPSVMGLGTQSYKQYSESFKKEVGSYFKDLEEYEKLPKNDMELKAARLQNPDIKSRDEWRKDNPQGDVKLFITGQVSSLLTDKARDIAARLIKENQIDPSMVKGIKAREADLVKMKEFGIPKGKDTSVDILKQKIEGKLPTATADQMENPEGLVDDFKAITDKYGKESLDAQIFLQDHPYFYQWALQNGKAKQINPNAVEEGRKFVAEDRIYNTITGATPAVTKAIKEQHLNRNTDYAKYILRTEARSFGYSENNLDKYVKYTSLTDKYEKQMFMKENQDFYNQSVNLGVDNLDNKPIDFDLVPTREVKKAYDEFLKIPPEEGKDWQRLKTRFENPELDLWMRKVNPKLALLSDKDIYIIQTLTPELEERLKGYKATPVGKARLDYRRANSEVDAFLIRTEGLAPLAAEKPKPPEKPVKPEKPKPPEKYAEYLKLPLWGNARQKFRLENHDVEKYLVEELGLKPVTPLKPEPPPKPEKPKRPKREAVKLPVIKAPKPPKVPKAPTVKRETSTRRRRRRSINIYSSRSSKLRS